MVKPGHYMDIAPVVVDHFTKPRQDGGGYVSGTILTDLYERQIPHIENQSDRPGPNRGPIWMTFLWPSMASYAAANKSSSIYSAVAHRACGRCMLMLLLLYSGHIISKGGLP